MVELPRASRPSALLNSRIRTTSSGSRPASFLQGQRRRLPCAPCRSGRACRPLHRLRLRHPSSSSTRPPPWASCAPRSSQAACLTPTLCQSGAGGSLAMPGANSLAPTPRCPRASRRRSTSQSTLNGSAPAQATPAATLDGQRAPNNVRQAYLAVRRSTSGPPLNLALTTLALVSRRTRVLRAQRVPPATTVAARGGTSQACASLQSRWCADPAPLLRLPRSDSPADEFGTLLFLSLAQTRSCSTPSRTPVPSHAPSSPRASRSHHSPSPST